MHRTHFDRRQLHPKEHWLLLHTSRTHTSIRLLRGNQGNQSQVDTPKKKEGETAVVATAVAVTVEATAAPRRKHLLKLASQRHSRSICC